MAIARSPRHRLIFQIPSQFVAGLLDWNKVHRQIQTKVIVKILEVASDLNPKQLQGSAMQDDK